METITEVEKSYPRVKDIVQFNIIDISLINEYTATGYLKEKILTKSGREVILLEGYGFHIKELSVLGWIDRLIKSEDGIYVTFSTHSSDFPLPIGFDKCTCVMVAPPS